MSDIKFKELVKLIRGIHADALPYKAFSESHESVVIATESLLTFAKELEARHPDE